MSRVSRIWRRTFTLVSALNKAAGILSAVLTILAFLELSTVVFGYVNHILPLVIGGSGIFILSVVLFIFIYTLLEDKTKVHISSTNASASIATTKESIPTDTIINPPPPEEDVEIVLEELVYQYLADGQTMYQRKRFQLRALRDGIIHYTDRYRWSGYGKCNVKSLTSGFSATNVRRAELGSYFNVIVSFPHTLFKGEEVDFTIEWEMFDEGKTAVPFLSTKIYHQTKHLSMRVMLPPELAPKRAYYYEFENYIDDQPTVKKNIVWSPATQCINYEIPHPKKSHKYLISWHYD